MQPVHGQDGRRRIAATLALATLGLMLLAMVMTASGTVEAVPDANREAARAPVVDARTLDEGAVTAGPSPATLAASDGSMRPETTTAADPGPRQERPEVPMESGVRLDIDAARTEARYRARERFIGVGLPTEAIGRARVAAGRIVLGPDGALSPTESRVTIDLATLRSDDSERDESIRDGTLRVHEYPLAEFRPRHAPGLPPRLPETGQLTFDLVGDLTLRGVSREVTWSVAAGFEGATVSGTATSVLSLTGFGITPPSIAGVLDLEDELRLEVIFVATRPAHGSAGESVTATRHGHAGTGPSADDAPEREVVVPAASDPSSESTATTPLDGTPAAASGPPVVELPDRYRERLILYATVERPDGTFRRMYVTPETLAAIAQGRPLPSGTAIVMETWTARRGADGAVQRDASGLPNPDRLGLLFVREMRTGWGTAHPEALRNGDWENGSFDAATGRRVEFGATSCLGCHALAEEREFTFTLPLLRDAAATGAPQYGRCERGGRQPCEP